MKRAMRKTIAVTLPGMLLLLAGCSRVQNPDRAEESCDLCHTASLASGDVHRMHLSDLAMGNFPFRGDSAAAYARTLEDTGASTFDPALDSASNRQKRLQAYGIECADCHKGVNPSATRIRNGKHMNGSREADFDAAFLRAKFGPGPRPSMAGNTCENMPCHGGGKAGEEGVAWTPVVATTDSMDCNSCHNTQKHKTGVRCDLCHYQVSLDRKSIHDFRKHINGHLDVEDE